MRSIARIRPTPRNTSSPPTQWVAAGATPQVLVDSISEIGASVLLPDGRVFVIGATGFTALYTPPPIANQAGTWAQGRRFRRSIPDQPLGTVDAPACVLPNGNVLFTAGPITSPATFQPPTFFFEYDPAANTITPVAAAATSAQTTYFGPDADAAQRPGLCTRGDTTVVACTRRAERPIRCGSRRSRRARRRSGAAAPTRCAAARSTGLTQCVYYGNDATQATNYPIVRLESESASLLLPDSTTRPWGLQTGTVIHSCSFTVPAATPTGITMSAS